MNKRNEVTILVTIFLLSIFVTGFITRVIDVKNCKIAPHHLGVAKSSENQYRVRCGNQGWVYRCSQGPMAAESAFIITQDDITCNWQLSTNK